MTDHRSRRDAREDDILRVVVTNDDALKATFACGTSVVLNPSATAMTIHAPTRGTTPTRQLTAFATSAWLGKLRKTLEIRNFLVDVPHYAPCALKSSGNDDEETFVSACKVNQTRWSDTDVELDSDGGFSLASTCGSASVRLSAHGVFVDVRYPALIGEIGASYEYKWQRQRFVAKAAPERWRYPISVLSSALAFTTGATGHARFAVEDDELSCTTLPTPTLASESILDTPWNTKRDAVDSWWASPGVCTFDDDFKPKIEWTPHAILWASSVELDGISSRCVAVMHERESAVIAQHDTSEFITIIPVGLTQRTIRLEDVPNDAMACEMNILPVMESLRRFERAVGCGRISMTQERVDSSEGSSADDDAFAATSFEVVRRTTIDGKGELCAYADGRVRGVFEDRTILLSDRNRENARLICSDGARVTVRVRAPVIGHWYIQTAMTFALSVWGEVERKKESHTTRPQIDVLETIERNKEWLKWCQANRGATISPSERAFEGSEVNRHDIVASEITKTAAWLASISTRDY